MIQLEFNHQTYELDKEETILNCFKRHGVQYPHSCQAGLCQACLTKTAAKEMINPAWQEGLPETLKAQGYFLACLAKPTTSLQVALPHSSECEVTARIRNITPLNYNVLKLELITDDLGAWTPGQYIHLITPESICRSYSIANIPSLDGYIELHIKQVVGGAMSQWLVGQERMNAAVRLRGPFGKCYYYNPNNLSFDMLLAGTGTGLAPLMAIIKSACQQNHQGKMTLVHGGVTDDDIYYTEEIKSLTRCNKSFYYDACVLKSNGRYPEASLDQRLLQHLHHADNTQVFVCGPAETTNKLKTAVFMAGVPSHKILSDAFV